MVIGFSVFTNSCTGGLDSAPDGDYLLAHAEAAVVSGRSATKGRKHGTTVEAPLVISMPMHFKRKQSIPDRVQYQTSEYKCHL